MILGSKRISEQMIKFLIDKKVLFLLDGLDELPNKSENLRNLLS
jgi:hypothetical protein